MYNLILLNIGLGPKRQGYLGSVGQLEGTLGIRMAFVLGAS